MEQRVADSAGLWSLTLRLDTASERPDWLSMRRYAMQRPPRLPGLRARFWRAERRGVVGRYLFDDRDSLETARQGMAESDSAMAPLISRGPLSETVQRLPDDPSLFDRPVFILSAPRAGSTLLYDLLAQCDSLWSLDNEMQPMVDGMPHLHLANRGYASQGLNETDADPQTAATLRGCLLTEMRSVNGNPLLSKVAQRSSPVRLLEKTPENALRVAFLKRIFPDALFIYLHRDLRQNVSSIIEAWKSTGFISIPELPGWSRKHWCFLLPEHWRDFDDKPLCQIAALQWSAANQQIIRDLETIPRAQWTSLSYAQLLADPVGEVERLCRFMGAEPGARLSVASRQPLPLSPTTLTPPSPIKWKSNPDFDPDVVRRLQPLAGKIRSLQVNEAPPVNRSQHPTATRFSCFVDELPACEPPAGTEVVPSLMAQPGNSLPIALLRKSRHRERFLADHPMLWIEDPATNIWTPLWLRHHQAWLCARLRPGCAPPALLTGKLFGQLHTAGVLSSRQALSDRLKYGKELIKRGRDRLVRWRFCPLPQLIQPVLRHALADYYRQLIDSGDWPLGDAQVKQRHGWHNERVARFLHHQLTDVVSRVSGRPLKPTYSFASAYRGGARLDAHMDREQCDYTLSLMVDELAPPGVPPWPLWFQTPEGQRQVLLELGDGVLFRGCELPHWRGSASAEHEQINLLFHFVPAEWAGVMD